MSPKATSASSVWTMPARSGNAQSSSSIATPPRAGRAGVISSIWRITGWSGPSIEPEAIRNRREYPICPAAPVTATRTGGLVAMSPNLVTAPRGRETWQRAPRERRPVLPRPPRRGGHGPHGRGRPRRADLAGGAGHPAPLLRAGGPPPRARARPRGGRGRELPGQPAGHQRVAAGPPGGGEGDDRAAHRDRRPAPHRDHDPVRPPRPGPGPPGPADLGGRPAGAAGADGHVRHRPPDRRGAGHPRHGRLAHPRVHPVPRDRCPPRPGVRADDRRRLPLDDLPDPVPGAHVQPVAAPRGRPRARPTAGTGATCSTSSRSTRGSGSSSRRPTSGTSTRCSASTPTRCWCRRTAIR